MKKIIFCDIPMKKQLDSMVYAGSGNTNILYSEPVVFPVNAILAENLKKNDKVKIILLRTLDKDRNSNKKTSLFMKELDSINSKVGAKLTYETVDSEFKETKDNHEARLKAILDKVEENSQIYADITFGPKPLPMILMCVLSFSWSSHQSSHDLTKKRIRPDFFLLLFHLPQPLNL